jgi:hypothetical protein
MPIHEDILQNLSQAIDCYQVNEEASVVTVKPVK